MHYLPIAYPIRMALVMGKQWVSNAIREGGGKRYNSLEDKQIYS